MLQSKSDKAFEIVNNILLLILTLVMIYPLYFVLIASFSEPFEVANGHVLFWPRGFTLTAYKNVLKEASVWTGYRNTIFYTLFGTLYNLLLTIPTAFVLTRKKLPGRKALTWYFLVTMYFSGGMIPTYLNVKSLGLLNTPWVLIIGAGVSCWNLLVTRQFFEGSIPDELYESAQIDGANDFRMFGQIAVPLALPIISVMALFYGVGHWNAYYNALLYIRTSELHPLQLVLRNILISNEMSMAAAELEGDLDAMAAAVQRAHMAEAMKYALIFIAAAPMLCAYPFVQKHFVKGVMIGAVKG